MMFIAGCGHNIGDPCHTNVDCNPQGDRFCDTASLNGYCTQENCTFDSCPGDSVCIRFFTPVEEEPCDPRGRLGYGPMCSSIDEVCLCDDSMNEQCVTQMPIIGDAGVALGPDMSGTGFVQGDMGPPEYALGGHCAPTASEHRWCMQRCAHDSDCREGYQCRETGTFGAEGLPSFDMGDVTSKFCAPTGITS